jgi:DNA polymerase-1
VIPHPVTIDFETRGIERRPDYPPEPVGVSIKEWGRAPKYFSWAHVAGGNNCTKGEAVKALRAVWGAKDGVLGHGAKFDYEIAITYMGVKELPWHKIHDTTYLLFLDDPHARSLELKPSAQRLLGMEPEEQDAVKEWILTHKAEIEARHGRFTPSEFGKHIGEAPGTLVAPYANGDVVRTEKLFKLLYPRIVSAKMLPAYDRERELMPIFMQNERDGLRVDVDALNRDVKLYTTAKERVNEWLRKRLKTPDLNIDSPDKVADALDRAGVVTEWNLTKTGKRSTAKGSLTPDMFNDARVASALGYSGRLGTCLGTFMQPWAATADRDARIHPSWNQVRSVDGGTRTGRPSCRDPNLLNIPKTFDDKSDGYKHPSFLRNLPTLPLIRTYVLPDKRGDVFGHRDFNQQEFRLTAHFEDGILMKAYNDDPLLDMHNFVRDEIARITGKHFERRPVKIINFGMLYGQGVGSLAESIGCGVDDAKILRAAQQKAIPGVKELDRGLKQCAADNEPIRTLGGRVYYCEPPLIINGRKITFEYKLLNYLMQGSAADFTKQAVIDYHNAKDREGRFLVTVYDEINSSMPKKSWKHEMQVLNRCMVGAMKIDVPMVSDGKVGPSWGNLEKCK